MTVTKVISTYPFCLSLPEWTMCCQENPPRVNEVTTSCELETAAVSTNDKRFNSFLTADKAEKIAVG